MKARPTPLFVPESIEFLTPEHGILRASACIVEDEQAVFFTRDGGKTWGFSHGRHAASGQRNKLSVTKNGVLWKLDDTGDVLVSPDNGVKWQRTQAQPIKEPQNGELKATHRGARRGSAIGRGEP